MTVLAGHSWHGSYGLVLSPVTSGLTQSWMFEMAVLQTAHLTLSPCCPADAFDFIDLERDPEVMYFLNGGAVDHDNIEPNATFLMPRGTEPYVWTARRTTDRAFVGWFCLWPESTTLQSSAIGCVGRNGAWVWPPRALLRWSAGDSEGPATRGSWRQPWW